MYPAVLLMYFISAAVILLASLALTVQVSLPYNKTGRASVLYSFLLVFLRGFCGLNTLFKISVIFKKLFNLSMSDSNLMQDETSSIHVTVTHVSYFDIYSV